ncbi:hypothetical protein [Mycetocola reblochoni]|uniref:Uncharacterized protein n=2 Tax=Mycetocola reblochoni TaxID=331618 RepID=A0A1R4ITV6_9MICO|nr:hypothetical protein [Mycetocola reblochoni]RLP71067.1 hypothetical protein D9V30_01185 [Mycetocola reblochoni]SJN22995.1 hypothetical protein FM119_03415 [Mycetocola reblochoni REB411]
MRSSRLSRTVRGSVAAGVATFVALMSHVGAGGAVPGAGGIAVPLVLSVVVCVLLSGRRLSLPRLSVSVGVSQLLFHTLFVLGSTGTVAGAGHSGHAAHALGGVVLHPDALPVSADALPALAMWLSHAAAAALTVLALHRGERAWLRLVDGVRLVAVRVVRSLDVHVAVAVRPRVSAVVGAHPRPLIERVPVSAISHRGPPRRAGAVPTRGL